MFSDGTVSFSRAVFSGGRVSFDDAGFSGGLVRFAAAGFRGGTVTFREAVFSGSRVDFSLALFDRGEVDFRRAVFSGGWVYFGEAAFFGSQVDFRRAVFSGGEVYFGFLVSSGDFADDGRWSHPPRFSWDGKPPTGVAIPVQPPEETRKSSSEAYGRRAETRGSGTVTVSSGSPTKRGLAKSLAMITWTSPLGSSDTTGRPGRRHASRQAVPGAECPSCAVYPISKAPGGRAGALPIHRNDAQLSPEQPQHRPPQE